MIHSLLDTDLYKFTMMQVVLHRFPGAMVEYRFKCRTPGVDLRLYADEIRIEIQRLCELRFTQEELEYLGQLSFLKKDFIDFLGIFQLREKFIEIVMEDEFDIIIKGPWLHTIMFEVPVLAIISEVYFRHQHDIDLSEGQKRLQEKIKWLSERSASGDIKFSEFGTRRRFSKVWQEHVIAELIDKLPHNLVGTSNVLFAKQFGIKPIGTMAHEYLQACQSLGPRLIYSQRFAFERWAQEYRGALGIVLSDVYSTDAFLNDFDLFFCKLFDGARHDSGDPIAWGERLIKHYQNHRIDPMTKTLVFTDQLDFQEMFRIYEHFKGRTNPAFGIGTNLTNDMGVTALQNVIKMVECDGQPVAKISDAPEKSMCRDPSYLQYIKQVFKVS